MLTDDHGEEDGVDGDVSDVNDINYIGGDEC